MASSLRTSPAATTTTTNRTPNVRTPVTARQPTFLDKANHTLNCISIVSVFAVHFLLITATIIASQRSETKELLAYYNAFFFVALFLAVYEHLKPGPLQLASVVNLILIIFDILVACDLYNGAAQLFLIINIGLRPLTTVVLLRKSYQRKRRLQLHSTETTSLASAIKNLLYNANADAAVGDLELGKPDQSLPTVLSTLTPNSRRQ